MVCQPSSHRWSAVVVPAVFALDAQRANAPTEVIRIPDEVRRGVMHPQVLGEAVGLAVLAAILPPVGPVVALDERGVDGLADPGTGQQQGQQTQRAEHHGPRDRDHAPVCPLLTHRGVAQVRRQHPLGLGWPARPWTFWLGHVYPIHLGNGRGIRSMGVAGDQQVGPSAGALVDFLDQLLAVGAIAFARHQAE